MKKDVLEKCNKPWYDENLDDLNHNNVDILLKEYFIVS